MAARPEGCSISRSERIRSISPSIGLLEYRALPGQATPRSDEGFTLVEALVAFAILSIVLSIIFWSTASGLELLDRGSREQIALRHAQSLLEEAGYAIPLKNGTTSGTTSDRGYSWTLQIDSSAAQSSDSQGLRDADGRPALFYDI